MDRVLGTQFRRALICCVAAAAMGTPTARAGDAAAGRLKAVQCQTCHGLDGLAKLPQAPHLAGQNEIYLIKAMEDYRGGARKDEMMTLISKELTNADIADLAAYYAGIRVTVQPPD